MILIIKQQAHVPSLDAGIQMSGVSPESSQQRPDRKTLDIITSQGADTHLLCHDKIQLQTIQMNLAIHPYPCPIETDGTPRNIPCPEVRGNGFRCTVRLHHELSTP